MVGVAMVDKTEGQENNGVNEGKVLENEESNNDSQELNKSVDVESKNIVNQDCLNQAVLTRQLFKNRRFQSVGMLVSMDGGGE